MKLLFATLLFMFLVLGSSFVRLSFAEPVTPHPRPAAPATIPPPSPAAHPPPSFCDKKCGERCKKAGVKDRCLKYCGICCQDCKCVPSDLTSPGVMACLKEIPEQYPCTQME
ncbi:hypothetical protein Goarm_021124 [Gossypium armourianum]|uniref:Uncharacterized protein n=1 Tax=Gossypium armourianum TaxID=34283 RepID=A0A7J9IQT3_9ROSI|nr:hypothetical protein [Gossypium armourianum]